MQEGRKKPHIVITSWPASKCATLSVKAPENFSSVLSIPPWCLFFVTAFATLNLSQNTIFIIIFITVFRLRNYDWKIGIRLHDMRRVVMKLTISLTVNKQIFRCPYQLLSLMQANLAVSTKLISINLMAAAADIQLQLHLIIHLLWIHDLCIQGSIW